MTRREDDALARGANARTTNEVIGIYSQNYNGVGYWDRLLIISLAM